VIGAWAEPATLLPGAPVTGAAYQQIQRIIANGLTKLGYPSFEVEPEPRRVVAGLRGRARLHLNVTIEPKPLAKPRPPLWLAVHAPATDSDLVNRTHQRIVRYADGWQTSRWQFDDLGWRIDDLRAQAAAASRDPNSIETHLYHNVNLTDDRETAIEESK